MSIAMSFDQLSTATDRLRAATEAIADGSADVPTDSGIYASDILATAAAAYGLALGRRRREVAEMSTQLADGLAGARSDMQSFEQKVVDTLTATEVPSA